MCFDAGSRPPIAPIAPIAGGAVESMRLALPSPDGSSEAAFLARAARPTGAGILILPDGLGLSPYFEELALRFAEVGIDGLVIDYFSRTAGPAPRAEPFEHMPHLTQTTWANLSVDIESAAATLRQDGRVRSLFAIGFCAGGRFAFLASTLSLNLAGAIGLYGWPVGSKYNDSPAPAEIAPRMTGPILGLFGGADEGISGHDVRTFEAALAAANVTHTIVTYPGAPHSFFHRKAEAFADASADAWARILEFVRSNTAPG